MATHMNWNELFWDISSHAILAQKWLVQRNDEGFVLVINNKAEDDKY